MKVGWETLLYWEWSKGKREDEQAPDFTLPDALGQSVTLSQLPTQGPVIIIFYRGEWCPYCNLELRAYQKALPQFQELGATLVAISPQTPDHSLSTKEKHELAFVVLSDMGNCVAREYGLAFRFYSGSYYFYLLLSGIKVA